MKVLKLRRIGDPILRQPAKRLTKQEIASDKIQDLIKDIKCTCDSKDYGVGLSASQVGEPLAISVIAIKPTKNHPSAQPFERTMINAEITEKFGDPIERWEGCISVGGPAAEDLIHGQVLRYKKVKVKYLDENAQEQEEVFSGFMAHVAQHEVDHVNGVLFIDLADPKTLMMGDEYKKRIIEERK